MNKLKTAIIGAGKVGHTHARALLELENSQLTAVCSRTPEKGRDFADHYGIKAYTDVEEMVSECGIDAVTNCTPHPVHAATSIAAMRAGAHVIVEKPLASTLEDCDAMLAVSHKTGKKLAMISQRRLYAPVARIKKAIDDGKLGIPILGSVTMLGWRDKAYYNSDPWRGTWQHEGGGVLVNQAPHQLDILQWYMGEIDELYGYWENLNHPYIEVEDTAICVIRFKNGALGNILVSNSQNPALYGKVAVHGSNGASVGVQTDGGAMFIASMSSITEPPVNDLWTIPGETELLEKWNREDTRFFNSIDATQYYHKQQLFEFLHAIIEDRDPMVPGEQGRITVEMFTAIYRSQRDNRPVTFPVQPEPGDGMDGRLKI